MYPVKLCHKKRENVHTIMKRFIIQTRMLFYVGFYLFFIFSNKCSIYMLSFTLLLL